MPEITLEIAKNKPHTYPIIIDNSILDNIADIIKDRILKNLSITPSRYAVITDSKVLDLYGRKVFKQLKSKSLDVHLFYFEEGEENKTRATKQQLEDNLLKNQFGRDSLIIAVGGGVVGDVAGYVAATYNRGVPYIQVPTTVVGMVDSSIGGKTGVDVPEGKNLVGAFHQPSAVLICPQTLQTLDENQYIAGLAEIIKHAVIRDKSLFEELEINMDKVLEKNPEIMADIILRNCMIKRDVVQQDEKESNLRQILNFGHTVGHAIEKLSNFSILHGEGVAIGMAIESQIAAKMNILNKENLTRICNLLEKARLPVIIPDEISRQEIFPVMAGDKKSRNGIPRFILPDKIGNVHSINGNFGIEVDREIIEDCLINNKY